MARKAICAIHGSYDARVPICPECARVSHDTADDRTRVLPAPGSEDPVGGQLRRKPASDAEADDDGTLIIGRRRGVPAADADAAWRTAVPWHRSATTDGRRGLLGWLIVKNGARRGQVYRADRGTFIGTQGIGRRRTAVPGEDPSPAEGGVAGSLPAPAAAGAGRGGILDIRDGRFVIRPSEEPFMEPDALKRATQGAAIEVNGIPVEGERTLRQDDEIGIGDLEYVLKILPPEQD